VGPSLGKHPRDIPVQLIWGSEDVLVPTELAYDALNILPAGTGLQFIEAAGHAPYLERPEVFNSTVLEFFDRHAISYSSLT
jgi:pimeloyl-ACP methyl ester carboxylesterase